MKLDAEDLPHLVVTSCLEVHRRLGLGLPALAYREGLAVELTQREILFERDRPFVVSYGDTMIETGEVIDFIVEDLVLLSIVARDETGQLEKEQVNARLRSTGKGIGFLVNFHKADLRQGIRRMMIGSSAPEVPYTREQGVRGLSRPASLPPRKPRPEEAGEEELSAG